MRATTPIRENLMPLQSTLFQDDPDLQACLTNDRAHLTLGVSGEQVAKVHFALFATDGLAIDQEELESKTYGRSTARAVLSYKTRRSIINRAYQSTPDDIVGKMTIASLDQEMQAKEGKPAPAQLCLCGSDQSSTLRRIPVISSPPPRVMRVSGKPVYATPWLEMPRRTNYRTKKPWPVWPMPSRRSRKRVRCSRP